MKRLIHRNEPNRPHISSVIINFKERRDKSDWMRRNFLARPACIISVFSLASRCRLSAFPLPCGPSGAPLVHLCAAGEGVLRLVRGTRKCFFAEMLSFSKKPHFSWKIRVLGNEVSRTLGQIGRKLPATTIRHRPLISTYWVIHRPIPKTRRTQPQITRESRAIHPACRTIHPNESRDSPDESFF